MVYELLHRALDEFESNRKEWNGYSYIQVLSDDILILVFSKVGKENKYFMVCMYGKEGETEPDADYFPQVLSGVRIPFYQISYHTIVGERGEGERYRDHVDEIVEMLLDDS
jgi:hypothetical protein